MRAHSLFTRQTMSLFHFPKFLFLYLRFVHSILMANTVLLWFLVGNLCLFCPSRSESRVRIKRIKLVFVVCLWMAIVRTSNHLATPESECRAGEQHTHYLTTNIMYNKYFVGIECIERNKLGH